MRHHSIYIPGILDDVGHVQSCLIRLWALHGVRGKMHVMPWAGKGAYTVKEAKLLAVIDHYVSAGHSVSILGASAGATAALNVLLARPGVIDSVILICPKINNSRNVNPQLVQKNPAFMESLLQLEAAMPALTPTMKQKIAIFVSPADGTVTLADSKIDGVVTRQLPAFKHSVAILYAISIGFRKILPLLRQNRQSA